MATTNTITLKNNTGSTYAIPHSSGSDSYTAGQEKELFTATSFQDARGRAGIRTKLASGGFAIVSNGSQLSAALSLAAFSSAERLLLSTIHPAKQLANYDTTPWLSDGGLTQDDVPDGSTYKRITQPQLDSLAQIGQPVLNSPPIYLPIIPNFYGAGGGTPSSITDVQGRVFTASASSIFSASYGPAGPFTYYNTAIGITDSFSSQAPNANNFSWATAGVTTNYWIKIQLPEAIKAEKMIIRSRYDATSEAPSSWQLEGSNNNSTWTVVLSSAFTHSLADGFFRSYTFSPATSFLYYRVYCFTSNGANPGLGALQLFRKI